MRKLILSIMVFIIPALAVAGFWPVAPYQPSIDFGLEVAKGKVFGHSAMVKFGENDDVDTGTVPEDAWDFGGLYTFSTSADIDSISSSSALDTQSVTVVGLDSSWLEVTQTVTLTGQTRVALATPLIRVYRAYNNSPTSFTGNVHVYVNTALTAGVPTDVTKNRAQIRNGNNQTLMCIYTIPADKTGYFMQGYVANSRGAAAASTVDFSWRARLFGGAFAIKGKVGLNNQGSGAWKYAYPVPVELPSKTDVLIRVEDVSANNTAVSCGFDIILVTNGI